MSFREQQKIDNAKFAAKHEKKLSHNVNEDLIISKLLSIWVYHD